jgi:hypothetical protein
MGTNFIVFRKCLEGLKNELLDRERKGMCHFFNELQKDREKLKLSLQYRL